MAGKKETGGMEDVLAMMEQNNSRVGNFGACKFKAEGHLRKVEEKQLDFLHLLKRSL